MHNHEGLNSNDSNLSPIQSFFRNKWIRIVLYLNIIPLIVIIAITIYNSTKSAIIAFDITPVDATITINGNTDYNTSGTYRLQPGTYSITVSHDSLDSKSFELNLPSNSSTLLSIYLSADNGNDFSFYELKENYNSTQKLLLIASPSNNQTYDHDTTAEKFVSEYGATLTAYDSALPISEPTRENPDNGGRLISIISIQKDDSCAKYLCVSVSAFGIPDIVKKTNDILEKNGINLKYLEIKYATN